MSAAVSSSPSNTNQTTRLLLGMTPPPSDRHQAGGRIRTLLDLLTTEKIGGLDRRARSNGASRWRNLREKLGTIGCCAAATLLVDGDVDTADEDGENGAVRAEEEARESSAARGMNLAAALAAERELRPPRTPLRRLLTAEKGELDREREEREREGEVGSDECEDSVCCVCMGRKKGAAIIPCGHTYCRVCAREVWLARGSCPLCNRPILEILDIF